ncbi:MAG: hypothetical protein FWD11_00105 [Micrococcales bacterium]|nr:hypothetical protein [Micrococcales bacterium]
MAARLGSFSIDALAVVVLAGATAVVTRSAVLGVVVAVEAVVVLVVWEARTGLTLGNGVLRLRTSRQDRPWSPGAVRALVRAGVVGAGAIVAVAGAWVVVASGGQDRTGRGRTWADRAAGTVVVHVGEPQQFAAVRAEPVRAPVPVPAAGPNAGLSAPRRLRVGPSQVPTPVPSAPGVPRQSVAAPTYVPPSPIPTQAAGPRQPTGPGSRFRRPPGRGPAQTAPLHQPDVTVLLMFDNGQRDQVSFDQGAVIGSDPRPQQPGDRLVVVDHDTVSADHLRVEHTADGVWLTDLGSADGTRLVLDGESTPLVSHMRTRIEGVVVVQVGQVMVVVSYLVKGGRP